MARKNAQKKSVKVGAKKSKNGGFNNDFMRVLLKESKNDLASIMEEETLSTTTEYINTGSLALNGLLVGDITKGIPNNKTIAFAGEEGCGKTYLALECVKHAITSGYIICYFDSENAVDKDMLTDRGIDIKKVMYFPIDTVEGFRDQVVKIVNKYNDTKKDRPKIMIVLDSLGNLSTRKEVADVEKGSDKKDMTRAQGIKSIFRVLNLKLAKAKIPMIITNHVYDVIGSFIPQKVLAGGSGLKYAASIIIYIIKSKAKDKDKNVVGIYMNCKTIKNRFCKPEGRMKVYLDFTTGLNQYYGLQDYGEPLLKPAAGKLDSEETDGKKTKKARGWLLRGQPVSNKNLWAVEWDPELLKCINENVNVRIAFGNKNTVTMDQISEDVKEEKK